MFFSYHFQFTNDIFRCYCQHQWWDGTTTSTSMCQHTSITISIFTTTSITTTSICTTTQTLWPPPLIFSPPVSFFSLSFHFIFTSNVFLDNISQLLIMTQQHPLSLANMKWEDRIAPYDEEHKKGPRDIRKKVISFQCPFTPFLAFKSCKRKLKSCWYVPFTFLLEL